MKDLRKAVNKKTGSPIAQAFIYKTRVASISFHNESVRAWEESLTRALELGWVTYVSTTAVTRLISKNDLVVTWMSIFLYTLINRQENTLTHDKCCCQAIGNHISNFMRTCITRP